MIDRTHRLALSRQAELLGISRGSLYYDACPVSAADLAVMRRIDELHLDYPFAGSRMLRDLLRGEGIAIGRERVTTMMRRMGIEAIYRRPHTSKPADGHKVFPYLLRGVPIERANQVWAMDITYIPMARGFVYLTAVVDWFSRRVLAWRVSISMEVDFCLDALDEAFVRHGRPEIFNTDQGSQFTSAAFTGLLSDNAIRISMDERWSAKTEQPDKWIPGPKAARMSRNGRGTCHDVHDATIAPPSRRRWLWRRSRERRRWPNWPSCMTCIRHRSRRGRHNW